MALPHPGGLASAQMLWLLREALGQPHLAPMRRGPGCHSDEREHGGWPASGFSLALHVQVFVLGSWWFASTLLT
jgi:hypothetical protein